MLRREKQKHDESAPFNVYQLEAYHRVKRRYRRHLQRNIHTGIYVLGIMIAVFMAIPNSERPPGSIQWHHFMNFYIVWTIALAIHVALVRFRDKEDAALEASLERYRDYRPAHKQKEYGEMEAFYPETEDDTQPGKRLADDPWSEQPRSHRQTRR